MLYCGRNETKYYEVTRTKEYVNVNVNVSVFDTSKRTDIYSLGIA